MDFKDQLKNLGERVEKMLPQIQTEEATKNALIMPFIQILGYDVFNPSEVNPEFTADIGIKKGEKVDYAIMKDGQPIILIECKHHKEVLDPHNSQLFRYFHTCKAKFGVLTNGLIYRLYTDLVEVNKMDEKPFLEINIRDLKDNLVVELKKFHKSNFDAEQISNIASELKYSNELKFILMNEFSAPSESFVRFLSGQVYNGKITSKIITQFTGIAKKTINQMLSDMINERLKSALEKENEATKAQETVSIETESNKVVTTEEEKEGFFIVKSILRTKVDPKRIYNRDTQSCFNILLDDSRLKAICRLWFNGEKKYISVFNDEKKEEKIEINSIEDIYKYSDRLLATLSRYESKPVTANAI